MDQDAKDRYDQESMREVHRHFVFSDFLELMQKDGAWYTMEELTKYILSSLEKPWTRHKNGAQCTDGAMNAMLVMDAFDHAAAEMYEKYKDYITPIDAADAGPPCEPEDAGICPKCGGYYHFDCKDC
jgi:hypothetical protein